MGISTIVLQHLAAGLTSLDELAEATGKPRDRLVKAVQVLKGRGLVHVCDALDKVFGSLAPGHYVLTDAGQAEAESGETIKPGKTGPRPRQRTTGLRERAWWHLRNHREMVSLKGLLGAHASGNEKGAQSNLYKYLTGLERAGLIVRADRRQAARQSKGWVMWMISNDVGPLPPVWRERANEVFDPNAGVVIALPARTAKAAKEAGQ